jgi:hypothetical protein
VFKGTVYLLINWLFYNFCNRPTPLGIILLHTIKGWGAIEVLHPTKLTHMTIKPHEKNSSKVQSPFGKKLKPLSRSTNDLTVDFKKGNINDIRHDVEAVSTKPAPIFKKPLIWLILFVLILFGVSLAFILYRRK